MAFTIKLDSVDEIVRKLGIQEGGEVQAYFVNASKNRMEKYVPDGDTLGLRTNVVVDKDSVTYNSPYAHYMWYGEVMGPNIPIKDKDGNIIRWFSPKGQPKHYTGRQIEYHGSSIAGSHWDKRMITAEKDDLIKEVANFMKRRNG